MAIKVTSSFATDPRRQQELLGRPIADEIYRKYLYATGISRFDRVEDEVHLLDRKYAIDAEIKLTTGQVLTCQEKFLSNRFSTYNTVTIEYMQNPLTGEEGDWFRLCPDLYFIAYFNGDSSNFEKWAILDTSQLKVTTAYDLINWMDNYNQDGRARASFKYVNVATLPSCCVLFQQGFKQQAA